MPVDFLKVSLAHGPYFAQLQVIIEFSALTNQSHLLSLMQQASRLLSAALTLS